MMTILKRTMWPKQGEEIMVYKNGHLWIEGHVTHADSEKISIMGKSLESLILKADELSRGIDDRSITIKKKKVQ